MARHHDPHSDDDLPEPTPEEIFGPRRPAPLVVLRAGPVGLLFDPEWAFLRQFRVGAHEALRAIYPAVRTATWKTVPPEISRLEVDQATDRFRVTFDARHFDEATGVDFQWRGELTGARDGTVMYTLDGVAAAAFETNRTGLCVLHPCACAGVPVVVGHVDGRNVESEFPDLVSPHQPFFGIRALTHEIQPGLLAKVTFDGEEFEMEDQRNWTDASFKSYGGALARGLPLALAAGQRVRQSVTFELTGKAAVMPRRARPVTLTLPTEPTAAIPNFGTRWAPECGPLSDRQASSLSALGLGHLVIDVDVTAGGWRDRLPEALAAARKLDVQCWLRVIMTPNHQPALADLAGDIAGVADRVLAVSVASRVEPCPGGVTLGLVRRALAALDPVPPLAASPLEHFADMNRFRPPPDAWCAVPMCPQVHTFDFESIMENVQSQPAMLATVRSFNSHPILVGPVSLTRRRQPDPRQRSLFCAAWTAGSLAAILPTGCARAVAYHEHAGAMGLPGTPAEDVLVGLVGAAGCAGVKVDEPGKVAALAIFDPAGARRLLVANLEREPVEIAVARSGIRFEFGPYATAWIEL